MTGLVLLSVKWVDAQPFIRLRNLNESASELVPAVGFRLNYRADQHSRRVCLGHVPFRRDRGAFHDCSKDPEPSSRRCDRCNAVEATFAANLHHAHTRGRSELDPAIREHLNQPNHLYLAGFRDGSIKVGTSTGTRLAERLTEQGAWLAAITALTDDGYAVRDLEDRVTAELGLPQAINIGRKISGLISPIDDVALRTQLARHSTDVASLITTMADSRISSTNEVWRNPQAGRPEFEHVIAYPLKLRSGSHDFEIIGAVGRVLAAQRPGTNDVFALDPQELYGIELETGHFAPDEIAIQDSLF